MSYMLVVIVLCKNLFKVAFCLVFEINILNKKAP